MFMNILKGNSIFPSTFLLPGGLQYSPVLEDPKLLVNFASPGRQKMLRQAEPRLTLRVGVFP